MLNLMIQRMENWNVFLGVDVSKKTLDVCCASRQIHIKVDNGSKGFTELGRWCRAHGIDLKHTLFVMEYTGGYEYRFLQHCQSRSYAYCRIPGLEIKRSLGMVRGKSDHADSFRIGRYGEEKSGRLGADKPLDARFLKLRQLLAFRKRLVRESVGYMASLKEREAMFGKSRGDRITLISKRKIKADQAYIKVIEEAIMAIIDSDERMRFNYGLITSIRGVGPVNAWMVITYTENFTGFTDARRFAVYSGVMPFEHTSGTSIRGRKRVSHLANKEIKQELSQAARVAMVNNPEIRAYAERKLENKPYPLVVNNVRFKLILRMFSLVKRGERYIENYIKAA